MPDFCTCGAELPPDARFCHRCGKPQREEMIPETVAAQADVAAPIAPVLPAEASLPRVNFHNPMAVRIGLLMASAASLSSPLPVWLAGLAGLVVWWLFAGFLSVYIYRRQTGQFLTVDSGLRMGWITGLLGSTMTAVLFTISMVPLPVTAAWPPCTRNGFARCPPTIPTSSRLSKYSKAPAGLPS